METGMPEAQTTKPFRPLVRARAREDVAATRDGARVLPVAG